MLEAGNLDSRTKGTPRSLASSKRNTKALKGRVWVTRENVFVDRIACAWLIRRFIDQEAKVKFVPGDAYTPKAKELRFDMYEGEFSHEGDRNHRVLPVRSRRSNRKPHRKHRLIPRDMGQSLAAVQPMRRFPIT
jgi:hypothetical protein